MAFYRIETFPVGAFQCNCSILIKENTKDAIIVDPGDDYFEILTRIDANQLKVRALWHTHAHIDHIGATKLLYEEICRRHRESGEPDPKVYLHEGDRWLYEHVDVQAGMLGMRPFEVTSAFEKINDGQKYENFESVRAIYTPGHTPGSCCLQVSKDCDFDSARAVTGGFSDAPATLLAGDTLFRRSIGRTDLWGGDSALIIKSIRSKLLSLSDEVVVIPGHGPFTSIEEERAKNPFLR